MLLRTISSISKRSRSAARGSETLEPLALPSPPSLLTPAEAAKPADEPESSSTPSNFLPASDRRRGMCGASASDGQAVGRGEARIVAYETRTSVFATPATNPRSATAPAGTTSASPMTIAAMTIPPPARRIPNRPRGGWTRARLRMGPPRPPRRR
jgi:hypothetical protein